MADIQVITEEEHGHGWKFMVRVQEVNLVHNYEVQLSWSDYDLWSRGRVAPQDVVRAIFKFLLEKEPADAVFGSFDCAVIRRYFPDVDKRLPGMLAPRDED